MTDRSQPPKAAPAANREQRARDIAGACGLVCITVGTGLLSIPWALIVLGTVLMGLSIWGAVRSDRHAARNP